MKSLVLLSAVFALSACKDKTVPAPVCKLEKLVVAGVSSEIGKLAGCAKPEAIEALIQAQLDKVVECQLASPAATFVCPFLTTVAGEALMMGLPAAAECTGGMAKEELTKLVSEACFKIIK